MKSLLQISFIAVCAVDSTFAVDQPNNKFLESVWTSKEEVQLSKSRYSSNSVVSQNNSVEASCGSKQNEKREDMNCSNQSMQSKKIITASSNDDAELTSNKQVSIKKNTSLKSIILKESVVIPLIIKNEVKGHMTLHAGRTLQVLKETSENFIIHFSENEVSIKKAIAQINE